MKNFFIACLVFLTACEYGQDSFITDSPQGTYSVKFGSNSAAIRDGAAGSDILFSISQNGATVIRDAIFQHRDSLDRLSFTQKYKDIKWLSENVLRLCDQNSLPQSEKDVYLVSNASSKQINYLIVSGRNYERFIVLNLAPKSIIKLEPMSQTAFGNSLSWVSAEGELLGGGKISNGVNFENVTRIKMSSVYCIIVKDDDISIHSRDFEGFASRITESDSTSLKDIKSPMPDLKKNAISKSLKCDVK